MLKTVADDIAARLALLHTRYQVVMGQFTADDATRLPVDHAAGFYAEAAAYLEQGLREGHPDAVAKVRAVVDPGDLARPEFWGTHLGRLLFIAGGYREETCTQTMAALLLACSRQWVSAMVAEGKLSPAVDRGVYASQVRGVLLARAARVNAQEAKRKELDKSVK